MLDTWVVVADGGGCRIFSSDVSLTKLSPVKELENEFHGSEHRGHSAKGHDSAHRDTESMFAAEVGREITRAVDAHEVRDILLVAPSRFLGDVLTSLPKATAERITGKVHKDLTAVAPHDLAPRLREALAENHDLH